MNGSGFACTSKMHAIVTCMAGIIICFGLVWLDLNISFLAFGAKQLRDICM